MTSSNQINSGMTILVDEKIYRVESCVKIPVAKGSPFIKAKLKAVFSEEVIEKNFKVGQAVKEVVLVEKQLEYLYLEGKYYLFLDIGTLEKVLVSASIIGDRVHYLKEGISVKAMCYGDLIFSIELPQFLELVIIKIETPPAASPLANATKIAVLETGAKIAVPLFVEASDIVKVDTYNNEYIQRV